RAHDALHILVALATEKFDAQPIRPRMHARRGHRYRRQIGDDVERCGHWARLNSLFYARPGRLTNCLAKPLGSPRPAQDLLPVVYSCRARSIMKLSIAALLPF